MPLPFTERMKMIRFFTWFCISLVSVLAYANYQGIVLSNFFDSESNAARSANHYHK